MKTAVIYYSLDGNCALVANEIASMLNADSIRLQIKDEKKRSRFGTLLWGCGMVLSGRNLPLKPYTFDPAAYDLIIIGAPVWAHSPAPPIKTFISEAGITGKKVALFLCHAGGEGDAPRKFKGLFAGNDIVAQTDFISPAKYSGEELTQRIADWVKDASWL